MTQESPADLVVQKLRRLIGQKASAEPIGSPEHYRLQELLELSDDALLETIFNAVDANPDRVGCPAREALRALAMRTRPLSDPLWDHVMECAPCRIDVREMGRDRPLTQARSPRRRGTLAATIFLVLGIGLGAWMLTRGSRTPTTITADLRQYVVRSDRAQPIESAFDLAPQVVKLRLVLPNGSEPGAYDVEIRDPGGRAVATAAGHATLQDFRTRLDSQIDLRSVSRGACQLAIRRTGGDWQLFPARIP